MLDKQYEKVKLHVTVMNTLFRDSRGGGYEDIKARDKRTTRQTFNAIPVLEVILSFFCKPFVRNYANNRVSNLYGELKLMYYLLNSVL